MKKKILIVATSMDLIGGQSIQAQRLRDAFAGNDQIETDFVPNNPRTLFSGVKFLRTIFAALKFWSLLLLRVPRAHLVHVFSSGMTGYLIASLPPLLISKIFRKRVILNYHSGEAELHLKTWKRTAAPTMKLFNEIIVPSQFLVDVFARFGLQSSYIFNFVDTEKFVFKNRTPLRPVFLSNRNFEAHYDVSCVIRAFSKIQEQLPEARLLVAGSGSEEAQLKKLTAELELQNVEFLGKIANNEMPKLYDSADVYLNSSIVDNMPLSILEAFSAGLPVVSTNPGGIPYIVSDGETGLLVETNDCDALAEKALSLFKNSDLAASIAEHARADVEKYAWEKVKNRWLEVYLGR